MNNYARLFTGQVGRDKYRFEPFEKPFPGIYQRVLLTQTEIEEVLDLIELAKGGFPITKDQTREVIAEYARKKADVEIPVGAMTFLCDVGGMLAVDFYVRSALGGPVLVASPLEEALDERA